MARRRNPYPSLGTPDGDALIGKCDGKWCGKDLRRGDVFVTTMSGHLVCRSCWHKPIGEWLTDKINPVPEEAPPGIEPASEASTTCGADAPNMEADYGPDNPFF